MTHTGTLARQGTARATVLALSIAAAFAASGCSPDDQIRPTEDGGTTMDGSTAADMSCPAGQERFEGNCVASASTDLGGTQDGGAVDAGEGFTVVSDCESPANIKFPAGAFTGYQAWGMVQPSNGGAIVARVIDTVAFDAAATTARNPRPGACAVLFTWTGMGTVATPTGITTADLPRVGLTNVAAYHLDVGPNAFGWAHDNLHQK